MPDGTQVRLLLALSSGVSEEAAGGRAGHQREAAVAVEEQLLRQLRRAQYNVAVAPGGEPTPRPGYYLLHVEIRGYTHGNAALRTLGRMRPLVAPRPGAAAAAVLRLRFQLRDENGRLLRVNTLSSSSRDSSGSVVDEVAQQIVVDVTRVLTEVLEE